ncbi:MAG: PAS domain S-box protein [Firmicutes bacterium]|nr:PAS domain S-box protein [Bacillota bacterium]
MKNPIKTYEQLLAENAELKRRLAACEEQAAAVNLIDTEDGAIRPFDVPDWVEKMKARRAGKRKTALWNAGSLLSSDGETTGAIAAFEDITERKRAEDELKKSQKKINDLIKHSPTPIYEIDLQHNRLISVNDAMCRYLGYEREEILKMNPGDFLEPESKKVFLERISNFKAGNRIDDSVEYRVKARDGRIYDAELIFAANHEAGRPTEAMIIAHDITERKSLEKRLKWDREQLMNFIDSTPSLIYARDLEGKLLMLNQTLADFYKLPKEKALGTTFYDFFSQAEADSLTAENNKVIETGLPHQFDELVTHDGVQKTFIANKFPLRDSEGGIYGVGAVITDVTELNLGKEALIQSEERFYKAFHANPNPMSIATLEDGVFMDVNDSYTHSIGYRREEMIGRSVLELGLWDDPEDRAKIIRRLKAGKKVKNCKSRLRTKQKQLRVVMLSMEQISLNGEKCVVTMYLDITELEQAETALRQSEERFNKAFMASPNPMSISTLKEGIYLDVNDSYLKTAGYTCREEMIGRSSRELNLWDDPETRDRILGMLRSGEKVKNIEVKCRTRQGELKTVLLSMEPINISGRDCIVTILVDITQLRRIEKEVARLDRLNLVGEMAASIGHEIRNPMTTIRGFLQMVKEREDVERYQEYYDLMIEELDRANSIISDYLSMAKDKTLELKPTYLNPIVKAIYPIMLADANLKDLQVRLDLGCPPQLKLDEKEIRQMLLNLARNGMEAMEPGGVLTLRTKTVKGKAVLEVEDQGKGIPPELMDKLGTPFQTTKENGTGLGLAVCYSIAHRHNATIGVDTGPGGTKFRVRFNAVEK